MATDAEVSELVDAVWQLLDDMGKDGRSVCLAAKALARLAFEPFRDGPELDSWMSLEEAEKIIAESDG